MMILISDILNQPSVLMIFSQKLQMRALVADAFLSKFQLTPDEAKVLRGNRDGGLHRVCLIIFCYI